MIDIPREVVFKRAAGKLDAPDMTMAPSPCVFLLLDHLVDLPAVQQCQTVIQVHQLLRDVSAVPLGVQPSLHNPQGRVVVALQNALDQVPQDVEQLRFGPPCCLLHQGSPPNTTPSDNYA